MQHKYISFIFTSHAFFILFHRPVIASLSGTITGTIIFCPTLLYIIHLYIPGEINVILIPNHNSMYLPHTHITCINIKNNFAFPQQAAAALGSITQRHTDERNEHRPLYFNEQSKSRLSLASGARRNSKVIGSLKSTGLA